METGTTDNTVIFEFCFWNWVDKTLTVTLSNKKKSFVKGTSHLEIIFIACIVHWTCLVKCGRQKSRYSLLLPVLLIRCDKPQTNNSCSSPKKCVSPVMINTVSALLARWILKTDENWYGCRKEDKKSGYQNHCLSQLNWFADWLGDMLNSVMRSCNAVVVWWFVPWICPTSICSSLNHSTYCITFFLCSSTSTTSVCCGQTREERSEWYVWKMITGR